MKTLLYPLAFIINMVETKETIWPLVHNDDTVLREIVFTCESKEEFVSVWEDRVHTPSNIRWSANIDKLTITSKQWVDYKSALFPPEDYILTEDDKRMGHMAQIETWIEQNPQFADTPNWPVIQGLVDRMNASIAGDIFDKCLILFKQASREYEPACFYRGEEE